MVESTCKEFNVAYKAHNSLFDALYHTLRWLYILGIDPCDDNLDRNAVHESGKKFRMEPKTLKTRSKSRRKGLSKSVV